MCSILLWLSYLSDCIEVKYILYYINVAVLHLKAMNYRIVMSETNLLFIINHILCQVLSKAYKLNVNKLFSKYCVHSIGVYNPRFWTRN
jgi:hypothetical protein